MFSTIFCFLVLISCLVIISLAAPACNDGFYARNGNLVIDLKDLNSLFNCVQKQHRNQG
ncbi:uncharacterized protein LOC117780296 [Drosophila innubila]|uniref:uncharacterized protein LOC117780296 n=1 Tax=Drosophila innubila TaxID=198719 RepID=UPI00148CFCBF|nr:uncharacterized protein LOC117780296 [Drosophila innubila]